MTYSDYLTIGTTIASIFVSVVLTIIGIKLSSQYHIRKAGIAREKYLVVEKISHGTKNGYIDSARIVLVKSSVKNALGFMDISLTEHPENIVVDRYSFIHSFIHNMFAPGKIILNKNISWSENTPSNLFEDYITLSKKLDSVPVHLIEKKIRDKIKDCRAVESTFTFPSTYTGPRYKKRLLLIAKGIGIVYSETEYVNGDKDVYMLKKYHVASGSDFWFPVNKIGNYWEYEINYEFGENKLNICE